MSLFFTYAPSEVLLLAAGLLLLVIGGTPARTFAAAITAVAIIAVGLTLGFHEPPTDMESASARLFDLGPQVAFLKWITWAVLATGCLLFPANAHRAAEQYALALIAGAAVMFTASADNLIHLVASFELAGLSLFVLIVVSSRRGVNQPTRGRLQEEALRSFAVDSLTAELAVAAFLILGVVLVVGITGFTQLPAIRRLLALSYRPTDPTLAAGTGSVLGLVATVSIGLAALARMGIVPGHRLRTRLFESVGYPVAGLVNAFSVLSAYAVLDRVLVSTLVGFEQPAQLLLLVLGGATLLLGSASARLDAPVPRLLGELLTAQTGLIPVMFAVAIGQNQTGSLSATGLPTGKAAALLALLTLLLLGTLACGLLASLERRNRSIDHVQELQGLARHRRFSALLLGLFIATLLGLPFTLGFWTRLFALLAALSVHVASVDGDVVVPHAGFVLFVVVLILATLLTAGPLFRLLGLIFLEEPRGRLRVSAGKLGFLAAEVAAIFTLYYGCAPRSLLAFLKHITE